MKTKFYCLLIIAFLLSHNLIAQENKVSGAISVVPATAENLNKGLILHYTFDSDETGAGKITDISGSGNHGKASGVRWTADGRNGGTYEFKSDGDRIEVPNNASLNPQQLTLAAWVKTSLKDDKWRRIFDKSYRTGYAMTIAADWQNNNWSGLVSMEIGPGTHFNLTRTIVADGQWHHVVATFNGTEQLLFVDGKPEGFPLRWGNIGRVGIDTFNLNIGCNRSDVGAENFGLSFRGLIDEPMIWNRSLSIREVAFLFESQNKTGSTVSKSVNTPICVQIADKKQNVKPESGDSPDLNNKNVSELLKGVIHFSDNDIRFRTADKTNVFVDPVSWPTDELVVNSDMLKPDLILITHTHGDHFQPTMLKEYLYLNPNAIIAGPQDVVSMLKEIGIKAIEVKPGQSYEMAGVKLSTVPSYFLEGDSHPKSNQWVGYILQLDGASYYITGDTEPLPEMENLKVDILMPLLFGCGGNLELALKMAELTRARVVVPVHTSGQEETIKRYLSGMPKSVYGAYYMNAKLVSTL